jgi:hypothetical protein
MKPETRRRACRVLRIAVEIYRRAPERAETLERAVDALAVDAPRVPAGGG